MHLSMFASSLMAPLPGPDPLAVARRDLASLMRRDSPDFMSVSGDFGHIVRLVTLDVLIKAIDDDPQLIRWTAVRAQRDGELLIARLKPIPDVTTSVGWRYYSDNGESATRAVSPLRTCPPCGSTLPSMGSRPLSRSRLPRSSEGGCGLPRCSSRSMP